MIPKRTAVRDDQAPKGRHYASASWGYFPYFLESLESSDDAEAHPSRERGHVTVQDEPPDSVLPEWVPYLPWKMQSILFSGLRGPDDAFHPNLKHLSKWMRSVSQNNADPSKPYMNAFVLPQYDQIEKELEHSPCHFVHHLADALAVIAWGHPDDTVCRTAFGFHTYIAEEIFHFVPEHPDVFAWRHRDKRDGVDPHPVPPWQVRETRSWLDRFLPAGYGVHR